MIFAEVPIYHLIPVAKQARDGELVAPDLQPRCFAHTFEGHQTTVGEAVRVIEALDGARRRLDRAIENLVETICITMR